jgi:hypothetical protein
LFGSELREADEEEEEKPVVNAGVPEVELGKGEPGDGESNEALKPAAPKRTHTPSVDLGRLRPAVHQIWPLLADCDPGAKDCLKDNRAVFRSAFAAEAFEEFEKNVRAGEYGGALEQLTRAVKRHGIHI